MKLLFRLLARLPLRANHALGAFLGRVAHALSPRFRRYTRENAVASGAAGPDPSRFVRANAAEIGKGATELAWALFRPDEAIRLTRAGPGWEAVERLRWRLIPHHRRPERARRTTIRLSGALRPVFLRRQFPSAIGS